MRSLHKRLDALDKEGVEYELDYIRMVNGFVFRNCEVLEHDADSLFVANDVKPETYIAIRHIVSCDIRTL